MRTRSVAKPRFRARFLMVFAALGKATVGHRRFWSAGIFSCAEHARVWRAHGSLGAQIADVFGLILPRDAPPAEPGTPFSGVVKHASLVTYRRTKNSTVKWNAFDAYGHK